ncbi:IucA/IucC family protein [Bradyrhizobium sp. CCBAU 53380]|uniref:IucA/IucC family protein n=1 Tax=Bradyrhizobium sp. CCBAU 53380 TaxID=1325117 RepID=UPI00230244A4|nr:IucA/IucC family protein [Bradyrhizobium sp. CCBAU 53380]
MQALAKKLANKVAISRLVRALYREGLVERDCLEQVARDKTHLDPWTCFDEERLVTLRTSDVFSGNLSRHNILEIIKGIPELSLLGWSSFVHEFESSVSTLEHLIKCAIARDIPLEQAAALRGIRSLWAYLAQTMNASERELFYEQWSATGHPMHACSCSRVGFSTEDNELYGPESGALISVQVLAVRSERWRSAGNEDCAEFFKTYFPAEYRSWNTFVQERFGDSTQYIPAPIHPWQLKKRVETVGTSDQVVETPAKIECYATLSLRTLVSRTATNLHLKLPVGTQMTSVRRGLSGTSVLNSCTLTSVIKAVIDADPALTRTIATMDDYVGGWVEGTSHGGVDEISVIYRLRHSLSAHSIADDRRIRVVSAALQRLSPVSKKPLLFEALSLELENRRACTRKLSKYLSDLITPPLMLFGRHGIALEWHQQNTLNVFLDGDLCGLVIRDLGAARIWIDRFSQELPAEPIGGPIICTHADVPVKLILETLFAAQVLPTLKLARKHLDIDANALLDSVEDCIKHVGDLTNCHHITRLLDVPWSVKCLLRMRLDGIEEPEVHRDMVNPFRDRKNFLEFLDDAY